jgi:DNA-binding transcriptional LysR family regulator
LDAIPIELRHLRYFLAVSEELHFRRAAERVHISQPPLSHAIRQLEDELGVQLLHRTSRVVTLTSAGRAFADEARKVLARFDLAVAEARRAGGAGPALRIGCIPDLPFEKLQRYLTAVHEHDPGSRAEVTHLVTLEQLSRLGVGELDLGIFLDAQARDGIDVEPLFAGEPLAAFLPSGHRLAKEPALGPDDLREEVLVVSSRTANPALHDRVLAIINDLGYQFAGVRQGDGKDPRDLMLAVASGLGVALAPSSFHEVSGAGDTVIRRPLDPSATLPDVVVAWRANPARQLRPALSAARDAARELRQETSEPGGSE